MTDEALPSTSHDKKQSTLSYIDFWPKCLSPADTFYENFHMLIPRANSWLIENPNVEVVKCETLEEKVTNTDDPSKSSMKFDVPHQKNVVFMIKGLRIWYTAEVPILPGSNKQRSHAQQIGYRNFLPCCVDFSHKYPVFEHLSATYMKMNEELLERPLEGKIVSVETVPFRLSRFQWQGPAVNVEQSQWLDSPTYHILYITRIFYIVECPAYEQIGAADFLPDLIDDKYQSFQSILTKVNAWLQNVKDIRVTNIQTLEASASYSDKVNTSLNFLVKADTQQSVKFVRVSYVRPKYGLPPGGLNAPKSVFYKTVVPSLTSTSNSGIHSSEFEKETDVWSNILDWMKEANIKYQSLVSVEMVYHPLTLVVKKKDQGETTVIKGTWVFPIPEDGKECGGVHLHDMVRLPLIKIFRLYFDNSPVINTFKRISNSHQRKLYIQESKETDNAKTDDQPVEIPVTPQAPSGTCFPFMCSK